MLTRSPSSFRLHQVPRNVWLVAAFLTGLFVGLQRCLTPSLPSAAPVNQIQEGQLRDAAQSLNIPPPSFPTLEVHTYAFLKRIRDFATTQPNPAQCGQPHQPWVAYGEGERKMTFVAPAWVGPEEGGKEHPWPRAVRQESPVFIVGCGHSGTSVFVKMLSMHSEFWAVPDETSFFRIPRSDLSIEANVDKWRTATDQRGALHWVEKTPSHVCSLGLIFDIFPNAKVLFMLRDGRDIATSIGNREQMNFEYGVRRWWDDNMAGLRFATDPRVKLMKYEDLVQRTNATLTAVLDFLQTADVPAEIAAMLNFSSETCDLPEKCKLDNKQVGCHAALRKYQTCRKLYDGSGRWKKKEGGMTEKEIDFFKNHDASRLLEVLNYEPWDS